MKIVKENMNFERGNPRDTLGVGWRARMKQEMLDDGWELEGGEPGSDWDSYALQWAAWNNHEEYVANLLDEGAEITNETFEGAIEEKSTLKIIEMLLDEGAYVTAENVYKAAEYEDLGLIKLLYKHHPNMDKISLEYIVELYAEDTDTKHTDNAQILRIIFDALSDEFFDKYRHGIFTIAMKGSGHNRDIVRVIVQQEMKRNLWNDKVK